MLMPRTIKGLSILTASLSGLVILILGGTTVHISHLEIEAQIDHRIEREMEALIDYHALNGLAPLVRVVRKRDGQMAGDTGYLAKAKGDGRLMLYALVDAQGVRVAGTSIDRMPPDGWSEFVPIHRPDGSRGIAQALSRALPGGGRIVVAGDRDALNRTDDRIIMVVLAAFGTLLLVGTTSTIAFGRLIHRRLALISGTAQGIIEGDYARRIPLDGSGSEFDRLSAILNAMLARIETLMLSLRQVSSDIAHDMRTPLGRIRQDIEALMRDPANDRIAEPLERTLADMDALLDLFTGLLGVTEVQGLAARKRFVPLPFADAVADMIEAYRPAFDDEGRGIDASLSTVTVLGDAQLLKRAVANLLENILVHAGDGARAALTLKTVDGWAVLRVADDGQGIPAEGQERIFERLVRLDPARSKPGHGLGLSMVRAIVVLHQGTVAIASTGPGLTIEIRLPARAA